MQAEGGEASPFSPSWGPVFSPQDLCLKADVSSPGHLRHYRTSLSYTQVLIELSGFITGRDWWLFFFSAGLYSTFLWTWVSRHEASMWTPACFHDVWRYTCMAPSAVESTVRLWRVIHVLAIAWNVWSGLGTKWPLANDAKRWNPVLVLRFLLSDIKCRHGAYYPPFQW